MECMSRKAPIWISKLWCRNIKTALLELHHNRQKEDSQREREAWESPQIWLDCDVIDTTGLDVNANDQRHSAYNVNFILLRDIEELIVTSKRASERTTSLHRKGNILYEDCHAPSFVKIRRADQLLICLCATYPRTRGDCPDFSPLTNPRKVKPSLCDEATLAAVNVKRRGNTWGSEWQRERKHFWRWMSKGEKRGKLMHIHIA